jgi:hypothetical protein
VDGADAKIEKIKITLSDGDEIERLVRDEVKEGKETRPIANQDGRQRDHPQGQG